MPSANLRPSRSHWSSPEKETRFPRRCVLDRTGTHGLPDPRSPVTSRFRPIFEDEQDAADGAAKASRISEKSKLGGDQSKKKQAHRHRTETFHPGDPASTDRQSRIDKSAIPPIPLRRNGGWWCGRIQWCGEISM